MLQKKILFIDQGLNGGGAERVMCTVIRDLNPEKFDIHLMLVSNMGVLGHLIPQYVKIKILGIKNTRKALFSTARVIKKIKPDIVYTTTARTAVLVLLARLFCHPYKVVMRFPTMPKRFISDKLLSGWKIILMQLLYNKADYVIAQTSEMAQELTDLFYIQKRKITTINNPIDTQFILHSIENQKTPFTKGTINVVASGTIYPTKGFDILIEAFSKVVKEHNHFHLHILGKDRDHNQQKLQQVAEQLCVSDHIHFLGFQKNPYPFYQFCDLFVLSSRLEGFPNVLLESLFLGKPVVATRCAPIVERLFENGENGFLVETENVPQMENAILEYKKLTPEKYSNKKNGIVKFIEKITKD